MRIIPIEISIDIWKGKNFNYSTLTFDILHLDTCDWDTSLFHIGWYQGKFHFEILFIDTLIRWIDIYKDEHRV